MDGLKVKLKDLTKVVAMGDLQVVLRVVTMDLMSEKRLVE
jgi:hypothetical protein